MRKRKMKITNNVKEFFELNKPFEYAECYIYLDNNGIALSTEWDRNCKPIIIDDRGGIMTYDSLMNKIKDCYVDSVEVEDWRIAIYLCSRKEKGRPKNMKLSAKRYFRTLMPGGYKDVTIFFDENKTKTIKHGRTLNNEYYKTFDKIAEECKGLTVHHIETIYDARGRRLRVYLNPSKN